MPQAYLSIGSNVDREHNVRRGVALLRERLPELSLSSVYESEPVGFDGEPFFNLAAGFECGGIGVDQVLRILNDVETACGRERSADRFGPRTLDVDLLVYGDLVCDGDPCVLPRPEITEQAFVLRPLAEIAPHERHPVEGKTYITLWRECALPARATWIVEFALDASKKAG